MKTEEIRKLKNEEIEAKIKDDKAELFNLRFKMATGNLEKPARVKELRKEIAKMKTILRERELESE